MSYQPKPPFDRPVRAVVTDVDGTITTPDRRLSVAAQTAVMRLEAYGIPVIVASGNVLPSARTAALLVGASGPVVAENGGLVYYRRGFSEEVVETLADRKVADEAYAHLREAMPGVEPLLTHRWRETEIAIKEGPDLARVKELLADHPVTVEDTGYAIHIIDERASKGKGVLRALEVIGVPPEEAMALGDAENDITVFEEVGLAVAVGIRDERLREVAHYVTMGTDGDGMFEAVARLLGPS